MNNEKRDTQCLNCKYSYRNKETILTCTKGRMTTVTCFDCGDYRVFIRDKEDLVEVYNALKMERKQNEGDNEDV